MARFARTGLSLGEALSNRQPAEHLRRPISLVIPRLAWSDQGWLRVPWGEFVHPPTKSSIVPRVKIAKPSGRLDRDHPSPGAARWAARLAANQRQPLEPILWVGFLTLLIAGPWFQPGFIFGTDFSGPRHYAFPDGPASYAALQIALGVAAMALPADIVGKLLIVLILGGAGFTSYQAVPSGDFLPRAVASVVYMFNPFVYDRLAYGQLTVLAGYAVLPLVASSVRRQLLEPNLRTALVTASALTLVGILDVHLALIAAVLAGVLSLVHLAIERRSLANIARVGGYLLVSATVALAASAYWLVPLLAGLGPEARTLARISTGDLVAFSTTADPNLGLIPNVLGLFGFWGEDTDRFASLKDFVPMWPVVLAVLLAMVIAGVVAGWRQTQMPSVRPWVAGLVAAGIVAAILDIGISDSHVAPLVNWLDTVIPPYRGMRDAGKWAALLALVYSQLIPYAAIALLNGTKRRLGTGSLGDFGVAGVVGLVLAVPLLYGNGLLFGMHNQIQPSAYPTGWYTADRALAVDPHPGRTIFLPWNGYLSLSFVRNANRIVASPAPLFFSVPVLASQDLEIPGVSPPDDADQITVSNLVAAGATGNWAAELATSDVKYVLLAREVGWTDYGYLDSQPGLQLVGDYGSILLYRNVLWH